MSTFQFNLTHKCNLNCPFCYSYRNNDVMTEEVIDGGIEFAIGRIKCESIDTNHFISFSGGEVFLGHYEKIPYIIDKIKESCPDNKIQFILQSNFTLFYIDTNEQALEVLKKVDSIGTSYDEGRNVRFSTLSSRLTFDYNLNYIKNNYPEKEFEVIICITTELLNKYPDPKELFNVLINNDIKKFELERLCKPLEARPSYDDFIIRPKNNIVRDWLTKAYEIYKKYQKLYPELSIATFESMEDSVKGIYHYDYGRNCQRQSFTILPNGDVGQCFINIDKPFYNVLTKELNIDNYEEICQREEKVDDNCKKCKYFKYCRGGCCKMEKDDTGCPTPYKIFEEIGEF